MSAVAPVMRVALPKRALAVAVAVVLAAGIGVAGWQQVSTGGSAKQHPWTDGAGVTLATPGVLDYPVTDATRVLTQQGFRVEVQPVPDRGIGVNPRRLPPVGTVLRQTPAPLTAVPRGTLVTLFVRAPQVPFNDAGTYAAAVTLPADEQAIRDLPVQPYIGRTLVEAQAYAEAEGRHVRVLQSLTGPRRMDLIPRRVNVELDASGRVVAADAG